MIEVGNGIASTSKEIVNKVTDKHDEWNEDSTTKEEEVSKESSSEEEEYTTINTDLQKEEQENMRKEINITCEQGGLSPGGIKKDGKDKGYSGSNYTWCNERKEQDIIWMRLDRMVANEEWDELFMKTSILHLARYSSDHCPLLINIISEEVKPIKYFKFLNFWVDEDDFINIIKEQWQNNIAGNIFWRIQQKLKRTSKALCEWSKSKNGDIFEQVTIMEDQVKVLEDHYSETLNHSDRMTLNKAKAELVRYHKMVDSFWRRKTNLKWQLDGNENAKYFHNIVRGRRKHRMINRIKVLNHVPNLINDDDNKMLLSNITFDEVRTVVFNCDPNSSPGLDGFTTYLFQKAWDVIANMMTSDGTATPGGGFIAAAISHAFSLFVAVSVSANICDGHVNPAVTFGAFLGVYATTIDPKSGDMECIAPISIGFVVGANTLGGGGLYGAAMNPSMAFGQAVDSWKWNSQWIYWFGPFVGAAIAALVYEAIFISTNIAL
ncbi:Aquaporin TIP1-1 [Capsicum baccatum]|uniref:Aquaporin TIP1-1 n=1 Tax=Capsicum baccatum TaxID=33114 RepID=A0A2G2XL92_CAPBA|nr:Aquaporin TIP1-1 [Capsicum baccatum]